MRILAVLFLICLITATVLPQDIGDNTGDSSIESNKPALELAALDKAISEEDAESKIEAVQNFLAQFPDSELKVKAMEHLAGARATIADKLLRNDSVEEGLALFALTVKESPDPASDDFFSKVLANIPANLYLLGERNAAFEIAEALELRASGNHRQLLRLATFYAGIRYATGARRLAEKALEAAPEDPLSYQTLGVAHQLGFNLAGAAEAYSRALELEPNSILLRQNLADMKRALGEPAIAEVLYREILLTQPDSPAARTGLILSLFDQNKRTVAEEFLIAEISDNPDNVPAMIGAAYWYTANGEPDLAIGYGKQAIAFETNAVWAYIVVGRAYMLKKDPVEAQRILVSAQKYASLPTLSYELALALSSSGSYFTAARELKKHFRVEDGKLVTDLDGRIGAEADNFDDLVGLERKSVIYSPVSPYEVARDAKLKQLLFFENTVTLAGSNEKEISEKAAAFAEGEGEMKTYRKLYAAERLLDNNMASEQALDLVQSAVGGLESSVELPVASTAVMAARFYKDEDMAASGATVVEVPEIEKSRLLKILRGRIEELSARALLASGKNEEGKIRLKRAASVLPKDSTWWRSSIWRLGQVYESEGNDKDALENYAASYAAGFRTSEHRATIETVYSRLNGSMDGLAAYLADGGKAEDQTASLFVKAAPADDQEIAAKDTSSELVVPADGIIVSPDKSGEVISAIAQPPELTVSTDESIAVAPGEAPKSLPEDVDLDVITKSVPEVLDTKIVKTETTGGAIVSIMPGAIQSDPTTVAGEKPPHQIAELPPAGEPDIENILPPTEGAELPDLKSNETVDGELQMEDENSVPANAAETILEHSSSVVTGVRDLAEKDEFSLDPERVGTKSVMPAESTLAEITPSTKSEAVVPEITHTERSLIDLGATRPRLVPPEKIRPLANEIEDPNACRIVSSHDRVSVLGNGGSFGVVVGLVNYNTAYVLRARSETPEDVSIKFEPDIGSIDGRAFFVIKSVSENTGEFNVQFETPCGTKIVKVDVR